MGAFVGRGDELGVLGSELELARRGRPRVVVVEGEAGMGKSTLLSRFVAARPDVRWLQASGVEEELLVAGGLVDQLRLNAGSAFAHGRSGPGSGRLADADAMAIGAWLVALLGDLQVADGVVAVVVDDLHWSDAVSAAALLFALRRMRADSVLAVVSVRPDGFGRLGESWSRFVAGDERVARVPMAGLSVAQVVDLAATLGVEGLAVRAAVKLVEHTGGNPLHCRALLEELGSDGLARAGGALPAPRALAEVVLARLCTLSCPAQDLLAAGAVLGLHWPVAVAAAVAGLGDPLTALDEALAAGLVVEHDAGRGGMFAFSHPLVHAAIRDGLGAARRCHLHQRAAALVPSPRSLTHRVAAAARPDDALAADLERAAREAMADGQTAQAAAWLAQAATACSAAGDRERLLLDAFEVLVVFGDVAGAMLLYPEVAELSPSARRSALFGRLDLFCGRGAVVEDHLVGAWEAHDPGTEAAAGWAAATAMAAYLHIAGRAAESVVWAGRAVAAAGEGSSGPGRGVDRGGVGPDPGRAGSRRTGSPRLAARRPDQDRHG